MGNGMLEVPGGRIAYRLTGPQDGPLVVAVHGMGDDGSSFRLLAPALAEAGWRVAVMDVRGYGESDAAWDAYGHEAVADDLRRLIGDLGGAATVVAHSIGCAAAVRAAADGAAIERLVLIGAFAGGTRPKAWMRAASRLVARRPGLWTFFYGTMFPGGKPDDHAAAVRALKANLGRPGRMAPLRAQIAEALSGTVLPYGEVRCPVLLITGAADPDMADPARETAATAAQLSATRPDVLMVEGSGHLPHLDRPAETAAAVLAFLTPDRASAPAAAR